MSIVKVPNRKTNKSCSFTVIGWKTINTKNMFYRNLKKIKKKKFVF